MLLLLTLRNRVGGYPSRMVLATGVDWVLSMQTSCNRPQGSRRRAASSKGGVHVVLFL